MYRVVYLTGPKKGRRVTVEAGDIRIGSAAEAHIRLVDPSVAAEHAVIEQRPQGVFVRTLASSSWVRVNDEVVQERQLVHGDEIDVGQERFLIQLRGDNPAVQRRRRSKFHSITFVAVWSLLIVQATILLGLFAYWRMDPIPDLDADDPESELSGQREQVIDVHGTNAVAPFDSISEPVTRPESEFPL